jgi:hypothetical protein
MITFQDNVRRGKEIEAHLSDVNIELWFNTCENHAKNCIKGKFNL